jgi:hypothetical protein
MVLHLRMRQKLYELAAPDLDRKEEHGALAVMIISICTFSLYSVTKLVLIEPEQMYCTR